MPEVPVFGGGPPTEPQFLRNSRNSPLPKGGERTPGRLRLSPGSVLATGLTTITLLVTVDAAAASCGVLSTSVSAATNKAIKVGGGAEQELTAAWDKYLKDLNEILSGPFARQIRKLWSDLSRSWDTKPPIPRAGPTQQGSFILIWDRERHHFEIEAYSDNHFEWFYCDRATDNYEGAEGNRQQVVAAANDYLKRLPAV